MQAEGGSEDTRSRALASALDLFAEQGFDGTSLQQIADALGITKAALYYHFRSKDDLIDALVAPFFDDFDDWLERHAKPPRESAGRRRALEDYISHLIAHRRLIAYLTRDLAVLSRPAVAARSARMRSRLEAILAGRGLDFTKQVRISVLLGGLHSAIAAHGDADAEQLREALLAAVRPLLRPSPARRPSAPRSGS